MKNIRLTGFNKVTEDSVEEVYRYNCFKWLFENSDEVFVDGKLISENTKLSYLTSSFNIKPMPKKIEPSQIKEGVEIGEKDFVELEIKRVERILLKIENDNNNFILYKKGEIYLEFLRQQSVQNVEDKPQQQQVKYTANEKALVYLFDLDTLGKQVPYNRTEGSLDAKELKRIGKEKGFDKPDTFYRGVKAVLKFDRNKEQDLQNISKDWLSVVKNLSNNWEQTKKYLIDKELLKE